MCTAFRLRNRMGRNFDYETSYNEEVRYIPANDDRIENELAILGIGSGQFHYPMLYDGMNEHKLCAAGLNFDGNAVYHETIENEINIAPYDMIPYILGHFSTVNEVSKWAKELNICDKQYSKDIPNAPLHWFICDDKKSIVIESTDRGTQVFKNPYDVLTNNPYFVAMGALCEAQKQFIGEENYHLRFSENARFDSRGKNTYGLPGDYTSIGRFVKCAYLNRTMQDKDTFDASKEAFHLLSSIEQIYGLTPVNNSYEYTIYSAVYDMDNLALEVHTYNGDKTFLHFGYDNSFAITLK